MREDPTAAAWGLFQVRFAFLVQELASAVYLLRRRRDPKTQFAQIFQKTPGQSVKALALELNQIAGEEYTEVPELRDAVCSEIKKLKDWRDRRIHARVELENGIALYDWKIVTALHEKHESCHPDCILRSQACPHWTV